MSKVPRTRVRTYTLLDGQAVLELSVRFPVSSLAALANLEERLLVAIHPFSGEIVTAAETDDDVSWGEVIEQLLAEAPAPGAEPVLTTASEIAARLEARGSDFGANRPDVAVRQALKAGERRGRLESFKGPGGAVCWRLRADALTDPEGEG